MSRKILFSAIFLLYAILDSAEGRCECKQSKRHYEDMGCTPVYAKEEDCCPSSYDCKEVLKRMTDTTSCFFNNKEYKHRESVPQELTVPSCIAACFCNKNRWSDFTCAHIDCPEFLGGAPLPAHCFRTYKPDSCCSSGKHCPPFDKLAKCEVGGKSYYEGQRFEPTDGSCVSCTCQKGFKGKFEEPFCKPRICAYSGMKGLEIRKHCAPLYHTQDSKCCPISWQCQPEEDAKKYAKTAAKEEDSAKTCLYGNRILKIGETFEEPPKFGSPITCKCEIPPYATCYQ